MSKRDRLSIEPSELYTWDREREQDDDDVSTASSYIDESRVSKKLKLPSKGNSSTESLRKERDFATPSKTPGLKRKKTPLTEPVLNELSLRDRSVEMHDTRHHHDMDNHENAAQSKEPKSTTKPKPIKGSAKKKASTPATVARSKNSGNDNIKNVDKTIYHDHSYKGAHPSPYVEDIDLLDEVILIRNPSNNPWEIGGWKISGISY